MKKKGLGFCGNIKNLCGWLKKLYRDAPGFVWLYLLEIPVLIGISLLAAYLPSVLVADITQGGRIAVILKDLVVLGGGLTLLYILHEWITGTQEHRRNRIGYRYSEEIVRQGMEADYSKIENAQFQQEFWQMQNYYNWSGTFTTQFLGMFVSMATALIGMILYVGMLSKVSLWILAIVVAGTLISYFVGLHCNRWDAKNRHLWLAIDAKTAYLSREFGSFESAKDVRLYHMVPWLRNMYQTELGKRIRYTVKMQLNYFLESSVGAFTQMVWEGAAYLYLIRCVFSGELDAADFVFYFGIITGFASWCRSVVNGMKKLNEYALYIEEAKQFKERVKREEQEGKRKLELKKGEAVEIVFQQVSFCYENADKPAVKNLNLTLKPGENIAMVGLNGAGKTTFIKLLCGFYEPTEGEILINGVNRRAYSTASLWRYFSGVFQDKSFFPLSLRENLVFSEGADEERLWNCLKLAGIDAKVEKLANGLDSKLGMGIQEGAVDFSGGEEQKLLLARALYKDAPVLVLDEPTAALDPLMESELYEKYNEFSKGKTTVFISHRLASTRFCDRILLMEDGEVVEEGSHDALMKQNGKYAQLFEVQSRYYKRGEALREEEA